MTAQDPLRKTTEEQGKTSGFVSPNLIVPGKIPRFLDMAMEEMRCHLLLGDSVSYALPTSLVYPCPWADLGL